MDVSYYDSDPCYTSPALNPAEGWAENIKRKMDTTNCHNIKKYQILTVIGKGTFGVVYKAKQRTTQKTVALKKVLTTHTKGVFPITSMREMEILTLVQHENIVNFIEICYHEDPKEKQTIFYLVFELCEHDLAGLLKNTNIKFSLGDIKMIVQQLLKGLYFLHSNKIIHRDIKSANILITKEGCLKIADFGLARPCNTAKVNQFTNKVVTLWYRAPELLLGERNYGPAIDMWSAGCIMAEMWTRCGLMQGTNEQHQLQLIIQLCGSITPESFKGVQKLELYRSIDFNKFNNGQKRKLKQRLQAYVKDPYALDLLDKLLTIDPAKRIDGDTALNHDFFWSDPLPCDLVKMLSPHTQSMFEYLFSKKKNEQNRHGAGPGPHPRAHPTANDGQYQDRVF